MHLLTDEAQPEAGRITQTSKFKPSHASKDGDEDERKREREGDELGQSKLCDAKEFIKFRVPQFSLPSPKFAR